MAARGVVEKGLGGHWKLRWAEPGPYVATVELKAAAEPEPERIEPVFDTPSRWIKPIGTYARREIAHAEDSLSYGRVRGIAAAKVVA
jgi:hypothetical protein